MKLNTDKCNLLLNTQDQTFLKIGNFNIKNSFSKKLLGITFDCKLKFSNHIEDICKKATRRLSGIVQIVLSRIVPYINISRRKILMNACFRSQVNYCTLIWMCYNRSLNRKMNRSHERCLRVIYSDKKSSFDDLLDKNESVSIHHPTFKNYVSKYSKFLKVKTIKMWMKFFVSGMRPLMNFDKDRVFIFFQLITLSAVQKVYDFSVRKSENLYQMVLNALNI